LIDRRWHSSVFEVQYFWRADCDTDNCLVVTKVRERLALSKQTATEFWSGKINLRKLNELEVRKQ